MLVRNGYAKGLVTGFTKLLDVGGDGMCWSPVVTLIS